MKRIIGVWRGATAVWSGASAATRHVGLGSSQARRPGRAFLGSRLPAAGRETALGAAERHPRRCPPETSFPASSVSLCYSSYAHFFSVLVTVRGHPRGERVGSRTSAPASRRPERVGTRRWSDARNFTRPLSQRCKRTMPRCPTRSRTPLHISPRHDRNCRNAGADGWPEARRHDAANVRPE